MDTFATHWRSLGVLFDNIEVKPNLDPEHILITTLSTTDNLNMRSELSFVLGWLEQYSTLIHVERLKSLSKESTVQCSALLGAISLKVGKYDSRWNALAGFLSKKLGSLPQFYQNSEFQIVRHGLDTEFDAFGFHLFQFRPEPKRKYHTKDFLLQTNRWFYNRQLFGTNFRADMATVMELHLATNAYQAMKVLGCSLDTAYRNWNALNEINWPNWLSLEAG